MTQVTVQLKQIISDKVMIEEMFINELKKKDVEKMNISQIHKHSTNLADHFGKKSILLDLMSEVIKLEDADTRSKF